MLKPIDHAIEKYGAELGSLITDFMAEDRYIYSGPDFFVLAYPHVKDLLLRRNLNKTLDDTDTWVIHFFAGDMKRLFEIAPFETEWTAFHRHDKDDFKFYNTEKLKRRICHGIRRSTSRTAAAKSAADAD